MAEKKEFLTYKGKPLVRQGNTIYYGDMADDYVIMMQILAKKESEIRIRQRLPPRYPFSF